MIEYIYENGQCKNGGNGKTNLIKSINEAIQLFDIYDHRIDQMIIVSACKDCRSEIICDQIAPNLLDKGIESYIINLIGGSNAENVIIKQEAHTYLKCIADNDSHKVCIGNKRDGICDNEFDNIINECLFPQICETRSPTEWPS